MRVQTFMGKVTVEALRTLDDQINEWLERHNIKPAFVTQSIGYEQMAVKGPSEPVVVSQVWY